MKKNLLVPFIGIFLTRLVSAYYGSYTSFSLRSLLERINTPSMILGVIFIISFAFLYFSLSRFFKDKYGNPNKAMAGIVGLVLAFLITYLANRTDFDFEGLFYNIGISSDTLHIVLPILLLVGAIAFGWRFGFSKLFLIIGGSVLILTFTNLIYERGTTLIIGIAFLAIGLWLLMRRKKRPKKFHPTEPEIPKKRRPSRQTGPSSREIYKRELEKRRSLQEARRAKIRARAKNIAEIGRERKKREMKREERYQKIKQQKAIEEQERLQKLEQIKQQKAIEEQERKRIKVQKMIRDLEQLAQKKDMELQKHQMMAARGVEGANQKVRTLQSDLVKITRRIKEYQQRR